MRGRRGFSNRSTVRRETTWARDAYVISLSTNGAYQTNDLLTGFKAMGGTTQGCTVVRTHVLLSVVSDAAPGDQFAWGILRGQNTDVGASIAGAPSPVSDPYEDWAYWNYETCSASTSVASCYGHWGNTNNLEVDLKAQRKLPELQMTWNLVIMRIATTSTLNVNVTTSTLLKLP